MLKHIFLFIFILMLLIFLAGVQAETTDLEIKSSVDKDKVTLDETFKFKIEIFGNINKTPEIKLPDFKKDFYIISSGQSQKISLGGRAANLIIIYEFILQPKEKGRFTIEAVEVRFKGRFYKTKSLDIEVLPQEESESLPDQPKEKSQPGGGIFIRLHRRPRLVNPWKCEGYVRLR